MAGAIMTNRSDFEDRPKLAKHLAMQLRQGRVALVLGAGVSSPFGLPDWKVLVDRMYANQSEPVPPSTGLEQAVEFLRQKIFKGRDPEFCQAVHDALYASYSADFKNLRTNHLLQAVGALAMTSRRGSAASVVTFNFDDLLETYLEYHGFVVQSVSEEVHWESSADVTVYHPHGLLPINETRRKRSKDLVIDFRTYSKIVGDPANLFHQVVFTLARRKTCLFLGLSGRDTNLDSIVGKTASVHPFTSTNSAFWGIAFGKEDAVAKSHWESRGVFYFAITDYGEIPDFLFDVCQAAADANR